MLYAFDNDTTIQEIFEDYADRLIEEMEAEQNQEDQKWGVVQEISKRKGI